MSTVRKSEAAAAAQAGAAPHHQIVSLAIEGGFLDGGVLDFVDGLNCVIGGRGAGKTTVLEFLRYSLGLMPDARAGGARAKTLEGHVQANLGNGSLRVDVATKLGVRYTTKRSWRQPAHVFTASGTPAAISLDRDQIFKADVYSQNEIEEIALSPRSQLALLDKFIDEAIREIEAKHRKVLRELEDNATALLNLDREMKDLEASAAEVPALRERLQQFVDTTSPNAEHLNDAHIRSGLREKERKALDAVTSDLKRLSNDVAGVMSRAAARLDTRIDAEIEDGPNRDVFEPVAEELRSIGALLTRGAQKISERGQQAEATVASQAAALALRHATQDEEYRALVSKTKEETSRTTERGRLQQRHVEATTALKELAERRRENETLQHARRELQSTLSSLRDERFSRRKCVAQMLTEILQPTIRVSVMQEDDREAFRTMLTESLRGSNFKYTSGVDRIVQALSPDELWTLVQQGDVASLAERAEVTADFARRVVELLQNTAVMFKIQIVELDDVPKIELLDGEYKESTELSTGQRCTTILPILLLENERPLLIDQPEDNLDGKFIYETVVQSLRRAKGRRQLIFVTHDPNILVLGETDRVFVLESDGKRARVVGQGSVDVMKEHIETLLEGGREAFLERQRRYGH